MNRNNALWNLTPQEGVPNPANALHERIPDVEARQASETFLMLRNHIAHGSNFNIERAADEVRRRTIRHNAYVRAMKAAQTPIERAVIHANHDDSPGTARTRAAFWLMEYERMTPTPELCDAINEALQNSVVGVGACSGHTSKRHLVNI